MQLFVCVVVLEIHPLPTPSAKVTLENKHGFTALDVAKNWGDELIFAIVYAKFATLPPPVEKKGGY